MRSTSKHAGGPAALRQMLHSKKALAGGVILLAILAMAALGPVVAPYNPSATGTDLLQGPSAAHLLGTTQTGQDVLSQLLVGARSTVIVGLSSALIATVLAVVVGLASGYFAGLAGEAFSFLSNLFLVLPAFPLVIVLTGYLRSSGSTGTVLIIGLLGWAIGARVIRAQTLTLRRRDFVLAARVAGEPTWRILFAELLPNLLPLVIYGFLFMVIFAVLTQAGLSFLGIGGTGQWSWGSMLYWAQNAEAFNLGAWWWYVPPGLCLTLLGAGLVLLNFGADQFANPRLRSGT